MSQPRKTGGHGWHRSRLAAPLLIMSSHGRKRHVLASWNHDSFVIGGMHLTHHWWLKFTSSQVHTQVESEAEECFDTEHFASEMFGVHFASAKDGPPASTCIHLTGPCPAQKSLFSCAYHGAPGCWNNLEAVDIRTDLGVVLNVKSRQACKSVTATGLMFFFFFFFFFF